MLEGLGSGGGHNTNQSSSSAASPAAPSSPTSRSPSEVNNNNDQESIRNNNNTDSTSAIDVSSLPAKLLLNQGTLLDVVNHGLLETQQLITQHRSRVKEDSRARIQLAAMEDKLPLFFTESTVITLGAELPTANQIEEDNDRFSSAPGSRRTSMGAALGRKHSIGNFTRRPQGGGTAASRPSNAPRHVTPYTLLLSQISKCLALDHDNRGVSPASTPLATVRRGPYTLQAPPPMMPSPQQVLSRQGDALLQQLSTWEISLNTVQDTLLSWVRVQELWLQVRLPALVTSKSSSTSSSNNSGGAGGNSSSEDSTSNAAVLFSMFLEADKCMKVLCAEYDRAQITLNSLITADTVTPRLQSSERLLLQVRERLVQVIDGHKKVFKRFYLLSESQLLHCFAAATASDWTVIFGILPYMYQHLREFHISRNCVTAFVSDDGAILPCIPPLPLVAAQRGHLALWMSALDASIQASIKHQLHQSVTEYKQLPLKQWLLRYPSQILDLSLRVIYSREIKEVVSTVGGADGLPLYLAKIERLRKQVLELSSAAHLSSQDRMTLSSVLLFYRHCAAEVGAMTGYRRQNPSTATAPYHLHTPAIPAVSTNYMVNTIEELAAFPMLHTTFDFDVAMAESILDGDTQQHGMGTAAAALQSLRSKINRHKQAQLGSGVGGGGGGDQLSPSPPRQSTSSMSPSRGTAAPSSAGGGRSTTSSKQQFEVLATAFRAQEDCGIFSAADALLQDAITNTAAIPKPTKTSTSTGQIAVSYTHHFAVPYGFEFIGNTTTPQCLYDYTFDSNNFTSPSNKNDKSASPSHHHPTTKATEAQSGSMLVMLHSLVLQHALQHPYNNTYSTTPGDDGGAPSSTIPWGLPNSTNPSASSHMPILLSGVNSRAASRVQSVGKEMVHCFAQYTGRFVWEVPCEVPHVGKNMSNSDAHGSQSSSFSSNLITSNALSTITSSSSSASANNFTSRMLSILPSVANMGGILLLSGADYLPYQQLRELDAVITAISAARKDHIRQTVTGVDTTTTNSNCSDASAQSHARSMLEVIQKIEDRFTSAISTQQTNSTTASSSTITSGVNGKVESTITFSLDGVDKAGSMAIVNILQESDELVEELLLLSAEELVDITVGAQNHQHHTNTTNDAASPLSINKSIAVLYPVSYTHLTLPTKRIV
eukprot:TRINITY_DN7052_c0_g2_i6.p1 TRINITY_DN7052_c0_g2~~TRINITY_DN7052_c0_g2_i6.p1  ORF type:complete len:1165 (-),score=218.65 TRINITY_DN7052_c0_g2_i6:136-3630(-)